MHAGRSYSNCLTILVITCNHNNYVTVYMYTGLCPSVCTYLSVKRCIVPFPTWQMFLHSWTGSWRLSGLWTMLTRSWATWLDLTLVSTHRPVNTYVYMYVWILVHITCCHMHAYTQTYTYTHMHMHTQTLTHACAHTHTHMHTHTHTPHKCPHTGSSVERKIKYACACKHAWANTQNLYQFLIVYMYIHHIPWTH